MFEDVPTCGRLCAGLLLGFMLSSSDAGTAPLPTGSAPSGSPAAQATTTGGTITFAEFLTEVGRANLDYAAQRYSVSIAEAGVAAARAFQNPVLQWNGAGDVTHSGRERLPGTTGLSLTQTVEPGGKRGYRIQGARQLYAASAANLDEFLRNLKLDAAAAFADALALERSAEHKRQSAAYLESLAATQGERLRAGDVSHADMLQTQVEASQFQNDLLAAAADADKASWALNGFLGRERTAVRLTPIGNLAVPLHEFDPSVLIADALESRPDIVALRHARDAAQAKLDEERANRIPNVDVGATWTHNTKSDNQISPSPAWDAVGFEVAVPIPLWNRNAAAIASARAAAEQAQRQVDAAELHLEVQIREALSTYRSAGQRVRHYQGGILHDAEAVLEARRFSYQRGQTTLLELLDAQRTANEVRTSYDEALADDAKALIELQRAAGIWDLEF